MRWFRRKKVAPQPDDFYEEDEPIEDIRAAWRAGEKGVTRGPRDLNERAKSIVDRAVEALEPGIKFDSGTRNTNTFVDCTIRPRAGSDGQQDNELLVDTPNPAVLDATLQQLGAVLVGGPEDFFTVDGHYVVRTLGRDIGFIKFACETQGYASVVAGPGNWTEPGAGEGGS